MPDTVTADHLDVAASGSRAEQNDWIARVLGFKIGVQTAPTHEVSIVALQKSRLAWDDVRKSIQSQLQSLEQAIVKGIDEHNADPSSPDKFDPKATAASTKRLYTLLDGLDADLIDKLDEALNASGPERLNHQAEAKKLIDKYQKFVAGNELIKAIDNNGFMATAIKPSVDKTLSVLAHTL